MSLTSRPKCRQTIEVEEAEPIEPTLYDQSELPASRVTFHKTFSMLINMGNVEKGCRRTVSKLVFMCVADGLICNVCLVLVLA